MVDLEALREPWTGCDDETLAGNFVNRVLGESGTHAAVRARRLVTTLLRGFDPQIGGTIPEAHIDESTPQIMAEIMSRIVERNGVAEAAHSQIHG